MNAKSYSLLFVAWALFLLACLAVANAALDPQGLYRKAADNALYQSLADKNLKAVTDLHISDRLLKQKILAQNPNTRCIVFGSSRMLMVTPARETAPDQCGSMLNMAVSGAGIEDLLLAGYYLEQAKIYPETFVIGLDHWSFRWNVESSWKEFRTDFDKARAMFSGGSAKSGGDMDILLNLLSFDYLKKGIGKLLEGSASGIFTPVYGNINIAKGLEKNAFLPDGSIVYSESQNKKSPVTGMEDYKAGLLPVESSALNAAENLIRHFQGKGTHIIFVQMPYHPAIFSANGPLKPLIAETDNETRAFAHRLNIPVHGDFNPEKTGCGAGEFGDAIHPSESCVRKAMRAITH